MLKSGRVKFICKSYIGFVTFAGNDDRIFRLSQCVQAEPFAGSPRLSKEPMVIDSEKIDRIVCRCNKRGDILEWTTFEEWIRVKREIAEAKESLGTLSLREMYLAKISHR